MNPNIFSKLPLEYQALWQVTKKKRLADRTLRELVSSAVGQARENMRQSQSKDILAQKLSNFGNKGSWAATIIQELAKEVYRDNKPEMIDLGQWISIEIELLFPRKSAETAFVAFVRKNGYSKMVNLKDDGSIKMDDCQCEDRDDDDELMHEDECQYGDGNQSYGKEIVLTCKYGNWEFIQNICGQLNKLKCRVNKSCGLHVHFDMRHCQDARAMSLVAHRLGKAVPALKQMLPESRQNNKYCNNNINKLNSDTGSNGRYAFVNVQAWHRHKTLEVRGHSGTTCGTKIINWIRILRTVMAKPNGRAIPTMYALLEKYEFDADLQVYMLERRAKFATVIPAVRDDVSFDNAEIESGQLEMNSMRTVQVSETERYEVSYGTGGFQWTVVEESFPGPTFTISAQTMLEARQLNSQTNQASSVA